MSVNQVYDVLVNAPHFSYFLKTTLGYFVVFILESKLTFVSKQFFNSIREPKDIERNTYQYDKTKQTSSNQHTQK